MTDLFDPAPARADHATAAARLLLPAIAGDAKITRAMLNDAMIRAYGGTDADGHWTQRESFEVLEHATALAVCAAGTTPAVDAAIGLMARLPTQTVRSEEQIDWQQFSTPLDLATITVMLANARADDIVLEPSAGNGLLVAGLPPIAALQLNEIDPARRERLSATFPKASVTGHDGAQIASVMASAERPSLILMNPPFSRSLGRGADALAAVRHLQAAIKRVRPGGRVVAIMPDWFFNSARMGTIWSTTLASVALRTSIRLTHAYGKHGTGVAVRLYVIDKTVGDTTTVTLQRGAVSDLVEALVIPPRQDLIPEAATPAPVKRGGGLSLLRSVRSKPAATPRIFRALARNEVLPVGYQVLETPAPLAEQSGVYLPYRPSRIVFDAAGEHPTALVESIAMGSIPAPIPVHVPSLPERTVTERLLSSSQLETVVYAGHAWTQYIPGLSKPDKEGVGLVLSDDGRAYRKGYFLGDGTGAGKGRQVAAVILDNWLAGRRKNIWISKNEALHADAIRDWTALGGLAADVQPLSRWKIDEPVTMDEGVLFVTYPTLRSNRGDATRLDQIIAWAGADFDGVIAFDEAHEMGGVAGGEGSMGTKKGSQQGIAGVLLQNHLPDARVLYASATGASEVNNLAYAVRLGLWGPETAFANREAFITQIRQGGIAAMELVARDLKATGLYTARALSFAGVEYDILRHELTPEQIAVYDTYADAWAIIHRGLEKALELTGVVDGNEGKTLNSGAKAAARSRFESCKQRFFGALLLSAKLPTVIAAIEQHLAADQSVVLQLVSTAEAILDRRLGELSPDERADLDIDLSPREAVIDYLTRAFPVQQMTFFRDDTGEVRSRPLFDESGHPVTNPEAEAERDNLVEQLCALPPIAAVLDAIITRFGTEMVAEVTGRTKRLITVSGGGQKLESRSARATQADSAAFMEGTKRILVFSDAGGTGRSYHASLDAKNQQQRAHLLLEPGWRADRAIQGLGRTHRTHQACSPLFRPVTTDCKGELRFTSTIARRLDSLGALTRGQRQTGGQNLFDPADNLESDYAKAALISWYHLLVAGKLTSTNLTDFQHRTGLELLDTDGVLKEDLPPIQRWLNRLLALPIGLQNCIFDEFLALVEARVAAAREAGTLDVGVETMTVETATVLDDTILRTDPVSKATSHLLTIEVTRRRNPMSLERVLRIADTDQTAVFVRNGKSGKVALRTNARSWLTEDGVAVSRIELMRPTRHEYLALDDLYETAWEECSRARFEAEWSAEVDEIRGKLDVETIRLATGLLLPIWSALPSDHLVVNRVVDAEGRSWLGRMVFPGDVPALFSKMGLDSNDVLSPAEVARAAMEGGTVTIRRPFVCEVKRVRVNAKPRIEISGAPADQLAWLKSIGCFTEIIAYKTRVFIPVETADAVLAKLMA
ncbi:MULTISPECIES: strawberry notch family protein [Sphingomonas]|jgi:predicted RNA methylase|uniref:Methylase n=11 Tax=Bacteria TaxID=2 RepID=A0A175Y653_9SPHN|nr:MULTISPECIES: strawberry notch family protein [Sphingomonas]MDE0877458.1 strawberry notch family protein [Sphingomonas bacterium]AOW24674.1 methylase [Sphingomonas melonis TY]KZB96133.1 methylase [Sphingomonas melonis TY]MCI4653221.1 strawberry notch family protein [Sphingomonas aquatilis]NJC35450.1 putative RNA methylase [Sphingomonas jejuensis]